MKIKQYFLFNFPGAEGLVETVLPTSLSAAHCGVLCDPPVLKVPRAALRLVSTVWLLPQSGTDVAWLPLSQAAFYFQFCRQCWGICWGPAKIHDKQPAGKNWDTSYHSDVGNCGFQEGCMQGNAGLKEIFLVFSWRDFFSLTSLEGFRMIRFHGVLF